MVEYEGTSTFDRVKYLIDSLRAQLGLYRLIPSLSSKYEVKYKKFI